DALPSWQTWPNISRVFFLLGRVENGNPEFDSTYRLTEDMTDEQLAERREQVNWLNLESRWLTIGARSGRITVAENAAVDPRSTAPETFNAGLRWEDIKSTNREAARRAQVRAAQQFALDMQGARGGRLWSCELRVVSCEEKRAGYVILRSAEESSQPVSRYRQACWRSGGAYVRNVDPSVA